MTTRTYSIYGLAFETDRRLQAPVPETTVASDLEWIIEGDSTEPTPSAAQAVRIPYRTHAGSTGLWVSQNDDLVSLHFEAVGVFELRDRQIRCRPVPSDDGSALELTLLGPVLAVFSSLLGRLALHASALALRTASSENRALGFLASSRGGKSSLACAMLARRGALVTDDVLVVASDTATAYPAWPQIRLWPSEVEHFCGAPECYPKVIPAFDKRLVPVGPGGFGAFQAEPVRLEHLFVPTRRAPEDTDRAVSFTEIPSLEAARRLLANSFAARTLKALDYGESHLDIVLSLLDKIRVQTLEFRDGLEHLPSVCEAIERQIDNSRER